MHKIVLVLLGRPEAARACLEAASFAAAALGGARIRALATRFPPETGVLPSEEVLTARRRAALEQRTDTVIAALKHNFLAWRIERNPDAEWIQASGADGSEAARLGQAVELIVVAARPDPRDRAGATLRAAVLETARPVIVVPDAIGVSLGHRIAIAWHEDQPATRAVLAAMPFLAAAQQVWVLETMARDPGGTAAEPPAILRDHGIAAEVRAVRAGHDIGAALLAEAHRLGADLLVMGAFAHSPLVEALLGGVTRTVLHDADLPVLLRH